MAIGEFRRAIGTFANRRDAEYALSELRDAGFNMDKVSVVAQNAGDRVAGVDVNDRKSEQITGGAAAGATAGAATGGIVGLVGSLGILAIPGVGPALEAGVLLANALIGGAIGAAGGGLVGALIGWGVPEDQAKYYDRRVSQGDYLLIMEGSPDEIRRAESILNLRNIRDWNIYNVPMPGTMAGTGRII